jgi:CHAD domain-containing protein
MRRRAPELSVERARLDDLAAALGTGGFTLSTSDPTSGPLRRTWLDTFDWRLHRAGLELEQIEANGVSTIELRALNEHTLTVTSAVPIGWPASAAVLPAGPVRAKVAAVAGIRALVETACFEGARSTLRLLDGERKTIARLHVDSSTSDGTRVRMSVSPVRGYDRTAGRAAVVLASVNGVAPAPASCYEQCLAAAGRRFDDAPLTRPGAAVTAEVPASVAVAGVLRMFLSTVEANVPGVIADVDTEFLHDLRVAVRRARSTVKLAGDALPGMGPPPEGTPSAVEQLAANLKWLGDATTPTRDLDVYLLGVASMAERLRAARAADLDAFRAHLAIRRAETFARLAADLRSSRFAAVVTHWRTVSSVDRDSVPLAPTTAEFGASCLRRAHRRVLRLGSTIEASSPPAQLHTLRKRCKELRYLLEIFERVESPRTRKRILPVLRSLQECLGEFQDSEIQAAAIRRFAAEMMAAETAPPTTLLAMGELAAQLDRHQQHARAIFASIFSAFAEATRGLPWTEYRG